MLLSGLSDSSRGSSDDLPVEGAGVDMVRMGNEGNGEYMDEMYGWVERSGNLA